MPRATTWERRRYALWAPLYDFVVSPLRAARKRSIDGLMLTSGERVLLVGAGTGEDLCFIPEGLFTVASDLTPAMLRRARVKAQVAAHLVVMDGHALGAQSGTFDAVVLHLILAVIPDPAQCLAEAVRVLRPGGRITILDKFVADEHSPSIGRRLLNLVTSVVATDITRRLDLIIRDSGVPVRRTASAPVFRGLFTIVSLTAIGGPPS